METSWGGPGTFPASQHSSKFDSSAQPGLLSSMTSGRLGSGEGDRGGRSVWIPGRGGKSPLPTRSRKARRSLTRISSVHNQENIMSQDNARNDQTAEGHGNHSRKHYAELVDKYFK